MKINIEDPQLQTIIFSAILLIALLASLRRKKVFGFLTQETSLDLKGLAILGVVFSHIGYFLTNNTQFLFPLSTLAGVSVNIFIFLSGFGLTLSALKTPLSPLEFYKKRLLRIFLPMWIVVAIYLLLDQLILGKSYPLANMIQNFFGFFPRANLYVDIDSPLWYFTFIFFYYLIFPWIFWKKRPFLSAITMFLISSLIVMLPLPVDEGVLYLYQLHTVAFPLGMLFAAAINSHIAKVFSNFITLASLFINKIPRLFLIFFKYRLYALAILTIIFIYTATNSGVDKGVNIEQLISTITTLSLVFIFTLKKWESRLLILLGEYSYEIYLIHWPLLYRYDLLYKVLPASLATALYIPILLALGFTLKKSVNLLSRAFRG